MTKPDIKIIKPRGFPATLTLCCFWIYQYQYLRATCNHMQVRNGFLTVMTSVDRCPHRTEQQQQLAVLTCKLIYIQKSYDKASKDVYVLSDQTRGVWPARQNERFRAAQPAEAQCEVDGQGRDDLVGSLPCSHSTHHFLICFVLFYSFRRVMFGSCLLFWVRFFILQGLYCFSFMCCIAFCPAQDPRGVGVPHELTPGSKGWKTRNGEMGECH